MESVTINDATLVQHSIVGVQSNKVYSITMLTLSSMLPSQETTPFIVEIGIYVFREMYMNTESNVMLCQIITVGYGSE